MYHFCVCVCAHVFVKVDGDKVYVPADDDWVPGAEDPDALAASNKQKAITQLHAHATLSELR